jgi:serine/threonine protein kinase
MMERGRIMSSMTPCPDVPTLQAFLGGGLREPQAQLVAAHADVCSTCMKLLQDFAQTESLGSTDASRPQAMKMPGLVERFQELAGVDTVSLGQPHEEKTPNRSRRVAAGAAPPDLPEQVGRYRVEEQIDEGGMGRILRVRDQDFDRPLAMKILRDADGDSERFLREARLTGLLQHPGIPPVHELGTLADGRPYFIMKLIQGRSLRTLLRERASPSADLPRFTGIFLQVCQTIGYVHARNVIHRDLKPSNVMVGAFGEVQVMDWGLAKVAAPASPAESTIIDNEGTLASARRNSVTADGTQAGRAIGTPAYMPPEQARGKVDQLDPRSDVFGLGAILCEILTGKPPFTDRDALDQAERGDVANAVARLNGCGADAELTDLARRCLAPRKEDRPCDGSAVADAVVRYQEALEERLRIAELEKAAALVREQEQRKRRRLLYGLGGAVAAVLVLGIAGTSLGLVHANQAAEAERAAKAKAESRLTALRAAVGAFVNDLPGLGHNLPLSDGLRRDMLEVSTGLIAAIREQDELADTYDFGIHALALREADDAAARGDRATERAKLLAAHDGFQRILAAQPEFLDRARNNVAVALAELARVNAQENRLADAARNFEEALALRRAIHAAPHGDLERSYVEMALANTLLQYGQFENDRQRYDRAALLCGEANVLIERYLRLETSPRNRETLRLDWAIAQVELARIAHKNADVKQVIRIHDGIVDALRDELKGRPHSAPLRASLATHASWLSRALVDHNIDDRRAAELLRLAADNRQWIFHSKEVAELLEMLGANHYQLGILAIRAKAPEASRKHFRDCLSYWDLGLAHLNERGEPGGQMRLIDRKILQMMARGRCGMHVEAAQTAAELVERAGAKEVSNADKMDYLMHSAVGYSLCAAAFPADSPQRADYYQRAMASARQSVARGYRGWTYLETDVECDALRDAPEFREALAAWKKLKPAEIRPATRPALRPGQIARVIPHSQAKTQPPSRPVPRPPSPKGDR